MSTAEPVLGALKRVRAEQNRKERSQTRGPLQLGDIVCVPKWGKGQIGDGSQKKGRVTRINTVKQIVTVKKITGERGGFPTYESKNFKPIELMKNGTTATIEVEPDSNEEGSDVDDGPVNCPECKRLMPLVPKP